MVMDVTPADGSARSRSAGLSLRERLGVLSLWVVLGLIESVRGYVYGGLLRNPPAWTDVLAGNLPWWLAWAALTPAVISMARRYSPEDGWPRFIGAHVAGATLLASLHHLVVGGLYFLTHTRGGLYPVGGSVQPMTLGLQLRTFFFSYFILNLVTYGLVVAGYYAMEYYKRYREVELRGARMAADAHAARLEALRMELNPHFLFNTLNVVSGLVRAERRDDAVRTITRLGTLLRATLAEELGSEIPVSEELDLLEDYIEIVRIRFGERVTVEIDVDEAALDASVPTLVLQPLVENAVQHGVARHGGPGSIRIDVREADGAVVLSVANSGAGFDDGAPSRPAGADVAGPTPGSGIGLENTRERLARLYGDAASLRPESLQEGGARVTLRIPRHPAAIEEPAPGAPGRPRAEAASEAAPEVAR